MEEHIARATATVAAERQRVWEAFTTADALASWFWPPRFAAAVTMDARPGGTWSVRSAPTKMGASGVVVGAEAPERLELTWRWDGENAETRVAIALTELGDGTVVDVVHGGFASEEAAADHVEGWNDCLARLVAAANSQRTV